MYGSREGGIIARQRQAMNLYGEESVFLLVPELLVSLRVGIPGEAGMPPLSGLLRAISYVHKDSSGIGPKGRSRFNQERDRDVFLSRL